MLSVVEKVNAPLKAYLQRRKSLFKNEDNGYVGAFLASLRSKLLPYHSKSLKSYPSKDEMDKIYKEVYTELTDLYIDEHWNLANADYLEQSYEILSSIHKLARKYQLVYNVELEETKKRFKLNDPNQFHFYDLSGKIINNYQSIFDIDKSLCPQLEELLGFSLKVKESKIEHQDAGNGVFLSCKDRKFILPGTLLGFYPGIIYPEGVPKPDIEINSTYKFLKRYDGMWFDPFQKVPYPFKPFQSIREFTEEEGNSLEYRKLGEAYLTPLIPISYVNPLAKGHFINHPPPDKDANVKFIDIEVPFTFYPGDFLRYLPYAFVENNQLLKQKYFHMNGLRCVGMVTTTEIKHDEELYVDYIDEDMTPTTFKPDWLLSPPPKNPYLFKSEYTMAPTKIDRIIYSIYLLGNPHSAEMHDFIHRDEGQDIKLSQLHVKQIQSEIENLKKVGGSGGRESVPKLGMSNNEGVTSLTKEKNKVLH